MSITRSDVEHIGGKDLPVYKQHLCRYSGGSPQRQDHLESFVGAKPAPQYLRVLQEHLLGVGWRSQQSLTGQRLTLFDCCG
jgi:hypothetical protein